MSAPAHPTAWTVHVEGPDDLFFYAIESQARAAAADINAEVATWPKDDFTPRVQAVVIPPDSANSSSVASTEVKP